jgi:hypothetical protein
MSKDAANLTRPALGLLLVFPLSACTLVMGEVGEDQDPSERGGGADDSAPASPSPRSQGDSQGPGTEPPIALPPASQRAPYEPLPARVYATKVKDLLTGLPLTDDELRAVSTDAKSLRGLIDRWMLLPQFRAKALDFFKNAFQQTQLDPTDLEEQLRISGLPGAERSKVLRSVEESFARTALALIEEGLPFTETVTTTRFMLNVPLMVALSYMDATPKDDLGRPKTAGYWILQKYPKEQPFTYTQTANVHPDTGEAAPIPIEQTLDPTSPHFMVFWYPPPVLKPTDRPCTDPAVTTGTNSISYVFRALFGSRPGCNLARASSAFSAEDWDNWRMVKIRPPRQGEERTIFWELPRLRDPATRELVLATPRVGFMTTPAFFANWPTNPSNGYRVTVNQALIVALGRSFDDRATTVQVNETSVDSQHVEPGTVCFACHQTLDPMRDFFKQSYSITYFQQLDLANPKNPIPEAGTFTVDGSSPVRGRGVEALAKAMAQHPGFAPAWVQKLCHFANATACAEDDPELKRVAAVFASERFNFKVLVRELLSSPLVTFTEETKTAQEEGVVMSIARRDVFCDRLSNRLGIKDICHQQGESALPRIAVRSRNLALGVPGPGYSRADEAPLLPHDPSLFFASGTEKLCMEIAGQIIDGGATTTKWTAMQKDAAIADFVSLVMGTPISDPRAPGLTEILQRHFAAAVQAKEKPADALRSTFVVACASPLGVSSGL